MINKHWSWDHKESILKESTCVKMSLASEWALLLCKHASTGALPRQCQRCAQQVGELSLSHICRDEALPSPCLFPFFAEAREVCMSLQFGVSLPQGWNRELAG